MEHQLRRGIYRPNAQRLSISLAPLVAQRSLLFRVKADLATKTNYGQLTPTTDESASESESESPALFFLTPNAQVLSAVLSAWSAASVYSQDSWNGNSPFVPIVDNDTRRHAIAFSPSLQWSDLSEEAAIIVEKPRYSAPLSALSTVVFQEKYYTVSTPQCIVAESVTPTITTGAAIQLPIPQINLILESQAESKTSVAAKPKKKKLTEDTPKPASKHSKAFGKVMSRLSLQPSKKELAHRRRTEMVITHPIPELNLKLPELPMSDPIRMSFIAKVSADAMPSLPPPVSVQSTIAEEDEPEQPKKNSNLEAMDKARRRRTTMPPPPSSSAKRSLLTPPLLALPPAAPPAPAKKGHRRYRSSPAVLNFDFHKWDTESMPPLPAMPFPLNA